MGGGVEEGVEEGGCFVVNVVKTVDPLWLTRVRHITLFDDHVSVC